MRTALPPVARAAAARRAAPVPRRLRLPALDRDAVRELTAVLAAGAAAVVVLALVVLPGVPTGVALGLGVAVSAGAEAAVLAVWARRAAAGAVAAGPTRRQARGALVVAHAVAAVPVGVAVLLAG